MKPRVVNSNLLDEVRELYMNGRHSDLLHPDRIKALEQASSPVATEALELRVFLVSVYLAKRQITLAGQAMDGVVLRNNEPDTALIGKLYSHREAEYLAGYWKLMVGRYLYYRNRVEDAARSTARASDALKDATKSDLAILMTAEARTFDARLVSQVRNQEAAETIISRNSEALTSRYGMQPRGGIDSQLARANARLASFDWKCGRLERGRHHVYLALYLFTRGIADDIAHGRALLTASRLEATLASNGVAWQARLLRECKELFAKHCHPYRFRADAQLAQSHAKAGELTRAEDILDELEAQYESEMRSSANREPMSADARQLRVAMMDCRLTRIWLSERLNDWDAALRQAGLLYDEVEARDDVPLRLIAEAALHHGIALVKTGDVERGRASILQALARARNGAWIAIQIRAHFALAESYDQSNQACLHYDAGATLASTARISGYLRELQVQLGNRLSAHMSFQVRANATLEETVEETKMTYVSMMVNAKLTAKQMEEQASVSAAEISRLKRRLKDRGST